MSKVYQLKSDLENYAHFMEIYDDVDNRFICKYWSWKEIDLNTYEPFQNGFSINLIILTNCL